MYRLTPRMVQLLRKDLGKYHELFHGGRCSGWQLEELIVSSINSDTQAQHKALWKEAGHDHEADITVVTEEGKHMIQVKSGKCTKSHLTLSGHRLGRFEGNRERITEFLNSPKAEDVLSVPYRQENGSEGRKHFYSVWYIDSVILTGLETPKWSKKGKRFVQTNDRGVIVTLNPSMSWQVWWKIPLPLIDKREQITIS